MDMQDIKPGTNGFAPIKARAAATLRNDFVSLATYQRLVRQLKIVARAEGKTVEQVAAQLKAE